MNSKLVPPKLRNGSVTPVNGKTPVIAPILMTICDASRPKTPTTISRSVTSTVLSAVIKIRLSSAPNNIKITINPKKPKVSPRIAKIESLTASGK